ncbi:hypothetical protein XarbCFBP7697_18950 [Xanthomonas arboricola]|uniref:DUF4435 domain-containing protein n=1 Tax=Xanthomonas arboricola TaxID=56448 RepID=UPI000CEF46C8|nr:DUF4435 domain-containing protein [Xanthomonas arboricola]PPU47611.1 hypothetical protein XarbCFBP7697_18950 [Xanthomonas arboricola]
MIKWPRRATQAIRKLYEPLQDIDVYVEDEGDEAFYSHLLKRLGAPDVRVARVFACGGRDKVVEKAMAYTGQRPALFLIDGDLEWVREQPAPVGRNLYRLDGYCIENFLICGDGALTIVMQDAALTEEAAKAALNIDDWMSKISQPLIQLFAAFGTASSFAPGHKTVSLGVGRMCSKEESGRTVLDENKVGDHARQAIDAAKMMASEEEVENYRDRLIARAMQLDVPLKIVSGKDFLLPLLDFHLQSLGCRVRRSALRVRLAMSCRTDSLRGLSENLRIVARSKDI